MLQLMPVCTLLLILIYESQCSVPFYEIGKVNCFPLKYEQNRIQRKKTI